MKMKFFNWRPRRRNPASRDCRWLRPDDFDDFTISLQAHIELFRTAGYEQELYGKTLDPGSWSMKRYQDLLVFAFIKQWIPPGSRLLEAGGGTSRIIRHCKERYECWNADPLEGLGSGPLDIDTTGFRLVREYIGKYSPELPDAYFDFVYSISALEHTPGNDPALRESIRLDLDRVLKPGGYSLHCLDCLLRSDNHFWMNPLLPHLFAKTTTRQKAIGQTPGRPREKIFFMPESVYNQHWRQLSNRSYEENGWPFSVNILWRKPL